MNEETPQEYYGGTFRPVTETGAHRKAEVLMDDPHANYSSWELRNIGVDALGVNLEGFFKPDFEPLPGFDLGAVKEEMDGFPEDVRKGIEEASPQSPEEFEYVKKGLMEYHENMKILSRYGTEGAVMSIIGSLTDVPSLLLTVGGGFLGGTGYAVTAGRVLKTGKTIGDMRRAHKVRTLLAEAIGGEAALVGTKMYTNVEYTADQAATDMMLAPLMAYGTMRVMDKATGWGKHYQANNDAMVEAMGDIIEEDLRRQAGEQVAKMGIDPKRPLKTTDVITKAKKYFQEKSLQKMPLGDFKKLEKKIRQVEGELTQARAAYDNWKSGLTDVKGKQDKRIRKEAERQRTVEVNRLEDYLDGLKKTWKEEQNARHAEAQLSRLSEFERTLANKGKPKNDKNGKPQTNQMKELPEDLRKYLVRTRHQMLMSGQFKKAEPKLPADVDATGTAVRRGEDPLDPEGDLPELTLDPQEAGYESSGLALRVDNYAVATRSKSATFRKLAHAVYTDAVGDKADRVGQGITADLTFDAKYSGILGGYNNAVTPAWRNLMKKNGVNWYNPFSYKGVNKVYHEASDKIRRAIHQGTVDQLPDELKTIANEYRKLVKASLSYAQAAGNRTAGRLKHSDDYIQFRYDKDKIRSMWANQTHRQGMVDLFTEGYYRGLQQAGKEVTREEAKFLAEQTLNRIRDINGLNRSIDIDDFLQDPINLLKEIQAELKPNGHLKWDNVKVQKLRDKIKGQGESAEFKRRADIDRNVAITLSDGTTLDFFKITMNNVNELADSYARSNIGKGVMARHMGVFDVDDLARKKRDIKQELEDQGLGENEITRELRNFDEMVERANGRPGAELGAMDEKMKAYMKSYMNINFATMLGGAGLAQVMDIMSSVFRNGLLNTFRALPGVRNIGGNAELREALMEAALARDIAFHSPNMMQKYTQFELDGSYATDGLVHATKTISEGVANISGLSPITKWMQEHSFTTASFKVIRAFRNGKENPFLKSETGWSNAQEARFKNLINKYTKKHDTNDFDGVDVPDFDKWPAKDAEDFLLGMYKVAQRQSSRSMAGENIRMLETPLGRIMTQFKQIVFTSWARKFLHGANNMRTAKGVHANSLMMTGELLGAYMMIWAKVEHKVAGMEKAERDEYIKNFGFENYRHFERLYSATSFDDFSRQLGKLGPEYFLYAVGYSPTLGGALGIADLVSNLAGQSIPGRRYQPLESSMFSNPTLSLGETLFKGVTGLADGEIDKKDFKTLMKLVPANNWYGMGYFQNSLAQELPDRKD